MDSQQSERDGTIPRLLAALVDAICRRPKTTLALAGILVAVSLTLTLTRLTYQTSRKDVLSPHSDSYQRWLHYIGEFGEDEDMVVVVKGHDRSAIEKALDTLAERIAEHPGRLDRVFYKVDLRHLQDRSLILLPADKIRDIQTQLQDMSLLLELPLDPQEVWKSVSLLQLVYEGERRLNMHWNQPQHREGAERFLRQLSGMCRTAGDMLDDPHAYRNPWHSMVDMPANKDYLSKPHYFFSGDGALAFLTVRPVHDSDDGFTGARKSIEQLRAILKETAPRFPHLQFGLTGIPVLENDEVIASQQDSQLAGQLSLLGVAVLYVLVFRGWRYPVFIVAALLAGMVWALGWLTVSVGHLNILSAAFVVMLIGMGDYGVLWVTRYRQERHSRERGTAMRETAFAVGPSILTAALTTAAAFFAAMLADFKAVAELGWIAGCGVLLCAFSTITLLPALLMLFDRVDRVSPSYSFDQHQQSRRRWLPRFLARPRLVLGISIAAGLLFGCCITRLAYRHNLLDMQARNLDSVQWEETLLHHTKGASWHAVCFTDTPEEALALKSRFEKLPEVSQVHEVASLVPRDQDRKLEQLRDIQQRLRRLPTRGALIAHTMPNVGDVKTGVRRLAGLLKDDDLAREVRPGLQHLLDRLDGCALDTAGQRLKDFDEKMGYDLAEDLHRLRDVSHPRSISVDDLPVNLRHRFVGLNGQWLLRIFARDSLWEYAPMQQFCAQVQKIEPTATGRPFVTMEGLRDLKNAFTMAAIYAALAMIAVTLLDFRDVQHTLLVALPVLLGMALTFGLLALCSVPLNPANLIAVPLILGVGADYGVHVVHDYRARGPGPYLLRFSTGQGILVTGLTTVLGFGTLMVSQHRGMASLGLVLTVGVSASMLAALVALPALLNLLSTRPHQRERQNEQARQMR